jgi:hypothetical protein
MSALEQVMLVIVWFIDIGMTILSLQVFIEMLSRHWRRPSGENLANPDHHSPAADANAG